MIPRTALVNCVAAVLALSLGFGRQAAFTAEPDSKHPFQAGKSMPFHVVDFVGTGPRGGGCPSVMISNSRKMGVEIWSRSSEDAAFQLAAALQRVLPARNRPNGFLLLFNKPTPDAVAKKTDKSGLKRFFVCVPRNSAQKLINLADPDERASTIVFVEHRKVIKAVWQFPPGVLDEEAIETVVKKTRELMAENS